MKIATPLYVLLASLLACPLQAGSLESDFSQPPETTRPRCYWYWMDGQITKEGITRDMEAMKRVGIGEGYIGIISGQAGTPVGGASKALTDEWWGFIEHAMREGTRLGVDVGLFNSPGWSQSGGPWVKPSEAMRYITLPELRVRGPQHFEGKLPVPVGEFQDLAVLAFPVPAGEGEVAKITSRTPTLVSFEMPSPFTARSITVLPVQAVNVTAELSASDDGQQYRTVKKFTIDRHNLGVGVGPVPLAPIVAALPATTARFFQLKLSAACKLGDIRLSPAARLENFAEKSLLKMFQDPLPPFDFYTWRTQLESDSAGLTVQPQAVRDLTKQMAADGTLRWDVPAGDWIILRTALTPTGTKNSPAPPEATGFEVDKMNRTALKAHFDAFVGNLLKRMPAADRKSWKHVVADSYEQGPQNWTDGFAADFHQRYGYDPLRFLPVMTGRIVGSADQSDRFLWDVRRLVADRVASDYVGALRDLCHENGLLIWLENYGHWGFPGEFLSYGGESDELGGEYWVTGDLGSIECRAASSAAHIYGKPVVWAEAFTGGPAFINTPRDLKARGDWSFCEGINQFVLHVYIHQPWEDKVPGVNAGFGTEFNRHNTWFEQSKAWIDYLRRCSVMLQAGKPVADVAYFIGEDAPKMTGQCQPELPAGYDFDYLNADVIENRLAVKDGRFVLPDGMSYRVLVLPESLTMRPELLQKLRDLVAAGGVVLGLPPSHSPSLENFPESDAEVQALARQIWGKSDLKQAGENALGNGRVIWGRGLGEVLATLGSPPDFESSAEVRFKHRRSDDADIYFVANPNPANLTTTVSFRIGDKAPELWWPDSGHIERPAVYEVADGVVRLPLSFGPTGSVFVVFRGRAAPATDRIVAVTHNGEEVLGTTVKSAAEIAQLMTSMRQPADGLGALPLQLTRNAAGEIAAQGGQNGEYQLKFADGKTRVLKVSHASPLEITGPWEVNFAPGRGAPEKITFDQLTDWTKRPEDGIRHFSGKATYQRTFEVLTQRPPGSATILDLGKVNDIATVRVNGRELSTLWLPPYRLDISAAVKQGTNTLEVEVVNAWNNRLAGDAGLPLEQRRTYLTAPTVSKNSSLRPAGLIGPVTIQQAVEPKGM